MPEADDHFLRRDPPHDVRLGLVGRRIALLNLKRELVCPAVLRPAQRADAAGDRGVNVRAGAGDHASGEGGRVELMLGVKHERGVHRLHLCGARRAAMQQAEKVTADRVVIGLHLDALAVQREVMPVEQHGIQRSEQPVGDLAGAGAVVVFLLRPRAAERGDAGAQHVHRVRGRGQCFEHRAHRRGQTAQRPEFRFVGREFRDRGQPLMHEEMRHFLKLTVRGKIEDVVAAVVQVVAAAAHRAERGVARGHAGERHGFLRLEGRGNSRVTHGGGGCFAKSASSFSS